MEAVTDDKTDRKSSLWIWLIAGLSLSVAAVTLYHYKINPLWTAAAPVPIEIDTDLGTIHAELYPDAAPTTVNALIKHIKSGYYNQETLLESRPQMGFVIARVGESMTMFPDFKDDENKLHSERGSLAIAKKNASMAYINNLFVGYQGQSDLEHHYTIIGNVTRGIELVERSDYTKRYKVNSVQVVEPEASAAAIAKVDG